MINNKKSQSGSILIVMVVILVFSVISIIGVTMGYFFFAVGNDYITLPMYNISITMNHTSQFNTAYEDVTTNYQNLDLSFIDDMWAFGYLTMVIISFMIAYKSRTNYFSWLAMLTYGLMFILFIAGIFSILINILYNDILLKLFINLAVNTPKLAYFVSNFGFIFLIHSAALLLTMVLDFDIEFLRNRKNKEVASLGDEII